MSTVIPSIIILSILIIVHECGHFFCAKAFGVRVEKFSLGFGPELFKRKRKDTEYSIAAIPLGGFVKMAGDNLQEYKAASDEFLSQSPGRRFWIIACGPLLNYLLGFLFFCTVCYLGYPSLTTKVGGLIEGFGAKEAGVQIGDKITAIDGHRITFFEELQKIIYSKKANDKVVLSVLRNNKEEKIEVLLKEEKVNDPLGQKKQVALLGIKPSEEPEDIITVRHGFFESFILGAQHTWDLTQMTLKAIWFLVSGKLSVRESVTGPVGIFLVIGQMARLGFVALLHLVAILSVSLAIFNFLPLPILDGGHIALLALEKIRKKSISARTEQIIARAGFTLIVTLAIFVTYNDIVRFFGDKIAKFFGK
jgi:regulator of sigma E protease